MDDIKVYLKNDEFSEPYKFDDNCKIWWIADLNRRGLHFFTFDLEHIFEFFHDYPDKLTPEQKEIFDKENPELASLKDDNIKVD